MSIQQALDAAAPGDTILLAAGIYTETLAISKAITLIGESMDRVILHPSPFQRVISISTSSPAAPVYIKKLTIRCGLATDAGSEIVPPVCGAQHLGNRSRIRVNYEQPCYEHTGGGICLMPKSGLVLDQVQLQHNFAVQFPGKHEEYPSGGAIRVEPGSVLTITNSSITENSATVGGAIYGVPDGDIFISNSRIVSQNLDRPGIFNIAAQSLTLDNSLIEGNNNAPVSVNDRVIVRYSVFRKNVAYNCGGTALQVNNSDFDVLIENNAFIDNDIDPRFPFCGDVELSGSLEPNQKTFVLRHNTFSAASNNPAVSLRGGLSKTVLLEANIFSGYKMAVLRTGLVIPGQPPYSYRMTLNVSDTVVSSTTTPLMDYTTIMSGFRTIYVISPSVVALSTSNLILQDARLQTDGIHLRAGSPAIDGVSESLVNRDLDGQYRPQGLKPDIGADEYFVTRAPSQLSLQCPADARGASVINAEISPADTTRPVTYTTAYEAGSILAGQLAWPVTPLSVFWRRAGRQSIVITATNAYGAVSAECESHVIAPAAFVRLPILSKR